MVKISVVVFDYSRDTYIRDNISKIKKECSMFALFKLLLKISSLIIKVSAFDAHILKFAF